MDDGMLLTPYGALAGVSSREYYESGELMGVTLTERNMVLTHAGGLIPIYEPNGMRRKAKRSITFQKNGMVRSVSLQEQQAVETPIGEFPAELVVFHETGELSRFFVVDGQLSGFWTIEDERARNIPLAFELDVASFRAMLTGVAFYPGGSIRSITLFPGEEIAVKLPSGRGLRARIGFSLFEDGALESVEPAAPAPVDTPIGRIEAFDPSALGVHADWNSLRFDGEGRIVALTTVTSRLTVFTEDGGYVLLAPKPVPSALDPEKTELLPLRLTFDYQTGRFSTACGETFEFPLHATVIVSPFQGPDSGCSPDACASCRLCGHET